MPEIIKVLLSVLHWWASLSMLSAIFPWSFSAFKSLLSQCITVVSGFYLTVWTTNDSMSLVFAPGKSFITNLFPLSDISQPFISLVIESPTNVVLCTATNPLLSFPSMKSWIIYIFLSYISDLTILLRETIFSFESLASGVSFNDSSWIYNQIYEIF